MRISLGQLLTSLFALILTVVVAQGGMLFSLWAQSAKERLKSLKNAFHRSSQWANLTLTSAMFELLKQLI